MFPDGNRIFCLKKFRKEIYVSELLRPFFGEYFVNGVVVVCVKGCSLQP